MKLETAKTALKTAASFLLVSLLIFTLAAPALAATETQETTKIKVAFYPLDGFFEYGENNQPSGYGVDYLNELSKYENIEWEYVPADSWEGIKSLMLSGKVDVRMPVSEPTNPSELYDYTVEPILTSYHALMTTKSRDDLYYQDYEKFDDLKIAVCENLLEKTGTASYLKSIDIADNLVNYPDYNSCLAAVESGEADALISNVMDLTDSMKILDKFAVSDTYITTLKNNPCYTVINDAMTELKLRNPTFQAELYQKYFPERATEPFTKEESEYIATAESLTVAVYPDRKPVSYLDDNGEYHGIAIDMANRIAQKIRIPFEYISVDTAPKEMLDKADIVMPVPDNIDHSGTFVTQSLLDTEILMAVPPNRSELQKGARVGVLDTTPGILAALEDLNDFELVHYGNNREGFNALQNGEIDAFANSSFVINWMLQNPRYSNLTTLRYQSFPLAFCMCGKSDDAILQSILSKAIGSITTDERNTIIQNGVKLEMDDFTLGDRVYVYRIQLLSTLVILILLIAFFVFYSRARMRYYRQIKEGNEKLEKANAAKSDFLSQMSHDMRTPMNGILGITHLLHDRTDPEEIKDDVNQIEMSAQYLLSLINDTLDMSKIEAGKMELHPEPIRSEDLFKNILSTAGVLSQQKGVELVTELPPIAPGKWVPVIADSPRVEQIFINLISNAIKFTPQGGTVKMHMDTVAVTDSTVTDRYVISDTGIGMSEEFMAHLYEPFMQERRISSPNESGTGLGLAIVKQIVDLMGGTITVESQVDVGTTFTVELSYPRYTGELATEPAALTDLSVLEGKRILLCEDNQLNSAIATRLLEKNDVIVEPAENGAVGVEMFTRSAEHYYDAILMDIQMPIMNGIEATEAIRALSDRSDAATIPIIAVTANAFDDDKAHTKAAGMNAHIAKPFEPDLLYETLAECLSKDDSPAPTGE